MNIRKPQSNWSQEDRDRFLRELAGRAACVLFGSGAPAASLGVDGDFYLDIVTKTLYVRTGGAWV